MELEADTGALGWYRIGLSSPRSWISRNFVSLQRRVAAKSNTGVRNDEKETIEIRIVMERSSRIPRPRLDPSDIAIR